MLFLVTVRACTYMYVVELSRLPIAVSTIRESTAIIIQLSVGMCVHPESITKIYLT